MRQQFTRVYILIEIFNGHSVEELNNYLSNRRISDRIQVVKNAKVVSKFTLNLAGLVSLYREKYPNVIFLYSFRPEDSLAYFKYLKREAKDLDVSLYGDYSKTIENKSKKLDSYFSEDTSQMINKSKSLSDGIDEGSKAF